MHYFKYIITLFLNHILKCTSPGNKGNILKVFALFLLGFAPMMSYSQPFTVTTGAQMSSLSSVTACGSNYTFSFSQVAYNQSNMYIYDNGTAISSGWGTYTGCYYPNWNAGQIASTLGSFSSNTTIYVIISSTAKTITFSTTAPGCGPTITTSAISGSPFCAGASVSIPFAISAPFTSGNIFTAQLSDASGSFSSPVSLGTLTSTAAGTISGTIPSGTTSGTGYRIRVVANTPVSTGTDNGSNLTINARPSTAVLAGTTSICTGSSANLTVTISGGTSPYTVVYSGGTVTSYTSGSNISVSPSTNTTYSLTSVTDANSCTTITPSGTPTITINSKPTITANPSSSAVSYCYNATATALSVTATGGGLTYQWYSNTTSSNSGGTSVGSGGTSASYTPLTTTAGTLYYYCVVSGTCSPVATSSVSGAITTNTAVTSPGAITNTAGCSTITYTKGSCSAGTCYWVSSATGTETSNSAPTYTVASTTVYVRASNGGCWSDAVTGIGTYLTAPTITAQPSTTNQIKCLNATATALSVTASGAGLTYQWYRNTTASNSGGTNISGGTSASYTPSTATAASLNYYYCAISGTCTPSVTSSVSGYVFVSAPTATATASPNPVYTNGTLTLTGGPTGMATYSWSGPNSYTSTTQNPSFAPSTTATAGVYTLTATNAYGCTATASTAYVTVTGASSYYYYGSSDMSVTTNWWTTTSGTGSHPTDFSSNGQSFYVCNYGSNSTPTLTNNWTVSGTGTKIIVGDGTNATNFTIPAGYSLTTTSPVVIDVKNLATISIANAVVPTLGTLDTNSTVNYNGTIGQTVQNTHYGNLTIGDHSSNKVIFSSGTVTVYKIFNPISPSTTNTTVNTGNTITFDGTNQDIPAFPYYNIQTQHGGTKTLKGSITIGGILTIGNITKFLASDGSSKIITFSTITGGRKRIIAIGTFLPTSYSTVIYAANDTVTAVNYYNLDLNGQSGTFEATDIIGVANNLSNAGGTWKTTGSTVKFNGSLAQTIPSFSFNNLTIDNSAGTSSPSTIASGATISVGGLLTMVNGILTTTSSNILRITNTAANAVGGGKTTSFINGPLKRSLPTLSASSSIYSFPVGNGTTYYPFSICSLTVSSNPTITIEALLSAGSADGSTLTSVESENYWKATITGTFGGASVSLTRQNTLSSNAIGFNASGNSSYGSIGGSSSGTTSIINSSSTGAISTGVAYFAFGTRTVASKTYNYSGGDITSLNSWVLSTDGTTHPTNFSSSDVTYVILASTSLTAWPPITGSNTNVQIGKSDNSSPSMITVTVPAGLSISVPNNLTLYTNATLTTNTGSTVNVAGNVLLPGNKGYSASNTTTNINNSGTLNITGNLTQETGSYSTINNLSTGIINLDGNYSNNQQTTFDNSGKFNITSGSFGIVGNQNSYFINETGGAVTIDNTGAPNATVTFTTMYLDQNIKLLAGSTFNVIGSNLDIAGQHQMDIAGKLVVQDGNLTFNAGGASFDIKTSGGVYVYDTDNSGDGILNINYGATTLVNNGTLYVEGVIPSSGSNAITVASGATMFVGNIGLYTGTSSNQLVVSNGGTLNFCGNKTAGADNVGTISSGGILNYAAGYYTTQTPGAQSDFVVNGSQVAAYNDAASCLAAFDNTVSNSLPISLDYFDAKQDGETIAIEWTTASETNNDFFSVLKSYDAISFEIIDEVHGAGTSTVRHSYTSKDENPQVGINYYRLKQTDFDGKSTFSAVKSITFSAKNIDFDIFPNPSKFGNMTLAINAKRTEIVNLIITDIKGSQVYNNAITIEAGQNNIHLSDYTYLNAGQYVISLIGNNYIKTKKVIVE